jgi:hypothetical protein
VPLKFRFSTGISNRIAGGNLEADEYRNIPVPIQVNKRLLLRIVHQHVQVVESEVTINLKVTSKSDVSNIPKRSIYFTEHVIYTPQMRYQVVATFALRGQC